MPQKNQKSLPTQKGLGTTLLGVACLAAAMAATLPAGAAESYPSKPVRIVVPFPPGGGADTIARIVSEKLQEKWGQSVIIENRPGATGNIGSDSVFRAAPDGYTLLITPSPPLVINKILYPKLSFNPDAFTPISLISYSPNVLLVQPKLGLETVQQLIEFAKAHPDRLNYATPGNASTPHLTAELFKSMAGINAVHVPYKGTGPAIADLMGGQVDMMFVEMGAAVSNIRSGKVRALAVGSEKRSASMPDIPAVSEVLPGFVSISSVNIVAPPNTPPAIANQISAAIHDIMQQPEIIKRFLETGTSAIGSTPAELKKFLQQESERWSAVIRKTGTTLE